MEWPLITARYFEKQFSQEVSKMTDLHLPDYYMHFTGHGGEYYDNAEPISMHVSSRLIPLDGMVSAV